MKPGREISEFDRVVLAADKYPRRFKAIKKERGQWVVEEF